MGLKYHKIFTHDHINSRELSEIYTSNSSDIGQLFIILEVPKHKIDQQPYIDEIINEIVSYFDTSGQDNAETLLEEILQQANQILSNTSSNIKIRNWINTIDLIVGIIDKNNVHMSGIGNINSLIIHNKQITPIFTKNNNINPAKAFVDIASGQLDNGDALIISTNSLFDYISKEKIKQIVARYSPSAAAIKMNELLETVPDFVTFNSLLVKNSLANDLEINPEDINKLDTEEVIKTDTIDVSKHKKSQMSTPRTKLVIDIKGFKNLKSIQKLGNLLSLAALFFSIIKKIFGYIFQKIKNSWLFLTSSKYRQSKEEKAIGNIKNITNKKYYWFQNLNFKKKIAVVILAVILLIFLQSLVFLTQEKANEQKNEHYNNALVLIESKYEEIDARLIYNDEETAEKLLIEIEEIINNMIAHSNEQQSQIDTLKENVFHKINKVRHIYEVPSPVELSDMSTILTSAQDIVQKQGVFYILGNNKLFQLKNDNLSEVFDFTTTKVQSMTDWPNENKVVLNTINDDGLNYIIFDLKQNKIVGSLDRAVDNTAVKDLVIYSDNLYVLDNQQNQVFKYSERGNSFSGGDKWLNNNDSITDVSSIAIDGSVYIIDNQGVINRFTKGELDPYDYFQLRPTIGSGAIIKTFRGSDYLYIIDPQNKRIIILDKKGNIKEQYTSQKFNNLTNLTVDPDEKAIYLLNNNHLYLLAIN